MANPAPRHYNTVINAQTLADVRQFWTVCDADGSEFIEPHAEYLIQQIEHLLKERDRMAKPKSFAPSPLLERLNALPAGTAMQRRDDGVWLLRTYVRNETGQLRPRMFSHTDLQVALQAAERAIAEAHIAYDQYVTEKSIAESYNKCLLFVPFVPFVHSY